MRKRIKTVCNICLEAETDITCNYCSYECCYQCIHLWSERSHTCPQCRIFESYDIEYSILASDEESIYDENLFDVDLFNEFLHTIEENVQTIENSEYDENEYNQNPNQDHEELIFDFSDNEEFNDEHPNYNYLTLFPPPPPPPYPPPPSPSSEIEWSENGFVQEP